MGFKSPFLRFFWPVRLVVGHRTFYSVTGVRLSYGSFFVKMNSYITYATYTFIGVHKMKPHEKKLAIELRKEGKSYNEITRLISVSKGTLNNWLKGIELTEEQIHHLTNKSRSGTRNGIRRKEIWEEKRQTLKDSYCPPIHNPKFMIGLGLYWGEGSKYSKTCTAMSSSDWIMLKAFTNWVNDFFPDDFSRFSVGIGHYYPERDDEIKRFWSEKLGIDLSNFIKSTFSVSKSSQRKKGNTLPYGTAQIRVAGEGNWKIRQKIEKSLEVTRTEMVV